MRRLRLAPRAARQEAGAWLTCWRRCIPITFSSHGASVQAPDQAARPRSRSYHHSGPLPRPMQGPARPRSSPSGDSVRPTLSDRPRTDPGGTHARKPTAAPRCPARSRCHARRADDLRREGPRHLVPADRAAAPPAGAPNVLVVLLDDVGFGASSAFGGPISTPNAERLAAKRAEVHPLPHHGALLAHARGAAERPQPPHRRHGRHHGDRHLGSGLQLDPAEDLRAAGRDPEAERLLDGAVRQVPRGAGLGDEPDGPVRRLADRQRLRVLLRLHRRRDQPVLPGHLRGDDAGRAREDARRGLPLHGRHDRQGDRVGAPAEGADAGQAVLRVLRARRDPRAASRHARVGRQVQGRVRRRAGTRCARRRSRGRRSSA